MKKIVSILFLTVVTSLVASAQFKPFFPTSTGNQKIVESALEDAVCVMRTEFRLQDTVSLDTFNIEGERYFGVEEGLCIKTSDGWIAPQHTLTPWKKNKDVKEYPELRPVVSFFSILDLQDTTWKTMSIPAAVAEKPIGNTGYSFFPNPYLFSGGLTAGKFDNTSDGWIVWVCREGDRLSIKAFSHSLSSSDPESFGMGAKTIPDNAIGGFYVQTTYPSVGNVSFVLLGILTKNNDGWEIALLDSDKAFSSLNPDRPALVPAKESGNKVKVKKNQRK